MRLEFESNASTLPFNKIELFDVTALPDASQAQQSLRSGIENARAGNLCEARRLFMNAAETEPHSETVWLSLASISEYPEELLFFLNNVLDINPNNERAARWLESTKSQLAVNFVQRGNDAADAEQNDYARQCFYQAAAYDSKNETAWLRLAFVSVSPEEKRAHLDKVLKINPENEVAQDALKVVNDETAQNLFRKAIDIYADDRPAANEMLDEALRKSPQLTDAWLLKSHLTDGFDEKIRCYEKILEINPAHEAAVAGLNSLQSFVKSPATDKTETVRAESKKVFAAEEDNSPQEETFFGEEQSDERFDKESGEEFNEEFGEESFGFAENEKSDDEFKADSEVSESERDETEHEFASIEESEGESDPVFMFSEQSDDLAGADENEENINGEESFQIENNRANDFEPTEDESGQNARTQFNANASKSVFDTNDVAVTGDVSQPGSAAPENNLYKEDNMLELENYQAENAYSNETNLNEEIILEESDLIEVLKHSAQPTANHDFTGDTVLRISPKFQSEFYDCPFCSTENDVQAFACGQCRAVLSLSDLETLLGNQNTDREMLGHAVEEMEAGRDSRNLSENELLYLGIGHINLKNFRQGFSYLQQASQANPNDVLLSSQVNALAIRVEEIERKEEAHDGQMKGRKILVVDDSPTVRKLISGKLEKSGHEVVCAVDGMEALAKLNEIEPDLILLDITMPRMDGYQVCKLIRNNPLTKNIPVVMISGKDGFFDKVRGRMAGTTGYITKPFGPETLMKALEIYIKNGGDNVFSEDEHFVSLEA